MRRFSSEGCLLDLDFLPWRKVGLKDSSCDKKRDSGTYIRNTKGEDVHPGSASQTPTILEPAAYSGGTRQLSKEHSVSLENMCDVGVRTTDLLPVCDISEVCRAYSDGQLGRPIEDVVEKEERPPPSPSSSFLNPFSSHFHDGNHQRPKLTTAKLHFKTLFGHSPHSSTSNLTSDQKDSVKERRSRLLFMRQWSQVGHGKKRRFSREELEKWAESLNDLLESQNAVAVFGAFLRSEFSEENLQFYVACEQYRHSSNHFSLQRRAKDICATYILPGSPREVNLDSKTRDLTIQLLQAPSHTSLSHAQKRIYSLLDMDCYPRFLQSSVYLSLLQDAD